MDSQRNEEKKEKRRAIPLFWWFGGAILTGGLLLFAWLYNKSNGEVKFLEKSLSDTKTAFQSEKQSLLQKITEAGNRFDALKEDFTTLNDKLNHELSRNRNLSAQNANLNLKQAQSKNDFDRLMEQMNAVSAENENYKNESAALRDQLQQLTTLVKEKDALNQNQAEDLAGQKNRIKADSISKVAYVDSINRVHTRKFFNATGLVGGYGLNYRDIPYSAYYYGLTTVNGILIDNHFMGGLGVGLVNFDAGLMAPLFMEFRYSFGSSLWAPYVYTDGGFELKFNDFMNSSLFVNPGVGLTHKLNEKIALDLGLGYFQHREALRSSFVNFRIGLVFLADRNKPAK
jgi:hypothetical protein